MDDCIRVGVSTTEKTLPGRLGLRRRAPMLYRRLMRGYVHGPITFTIHGTDCGLSPRIRSFYPGVASAHFPQIGNSMPVGHIEAPEAERISGTPVDFGKRSGLDGRSSARATRVVGSLDHAVLPMPPVSSEVVLLWSPLTYP